MRGQKMTTLVGDVDVDALVVIRDPATAVLSPNFSLEAEATTGGTEAAAHESESESGRLAWQQRFHDLPLEIHANIMSQLGPVSRLCFGLTSAWFYSVFHFVCDDLPGTDEWWNKASERCYNILRSPTDLRMKEAQNDDDLVWRVSWDWYDHHHDQTVVWYRDLQELLADETSLWAGLWYCAECRKYKPGSAYRGSAFEEQMALKYPAEWCLSQKVEQWWWIETCRRCRAVAILIDWEGRPAVRDDESPRHEENDLIGLGKEGPEGVRVWGHSDTRHDFRKCNYWDRQYYDTLDEVCEKLGL
ncbi:hypothetical protein MBM_07946 [Drepanopeziza brunnea f. sp. 'multigermtubi' MB_m1]|uniref:F-box domain-containing protein n=1 Tax=Marssonina brunnea f. sp. multigermtubi (strain MB_m1) TaxID=1072389 RepID=K1W950_MARBU|nr:uncharacterized protein MBM_07946 [Drepanopeziza brunnea f. sp. 'multigermtubi' MB_m1]EKD13745.1 hypothetical protein MBM_07946 [Drepanopeziza brunnea f. sp. 'multigermtubi' MB_m1]